jgi:formate dehydrogenase (coenzyme F420) alpha subunit
MARLTKPSICRICGQNCGILVTDDGRELNIEGNPHHPISKGFVCHLGKQFTKIHTSRDRLTQPLLRRGAVWATISYGEALEVLTSNLRRCRDEYGPQSVVFYKGESLKHQEVDDYFRHLSHGFGSPNYMSVGSLCNSSLTLAYGLTNGGIPVPDLRRINLTIAWGTNPAISSVRMFDALREARTKGMKLVAIDPARTQTARTADLHLPITPGSDGFLALAFIKYAIEKRCIKQQAPAKNGWAKLTSLVSDLSFDDLLNRTGIPEADFQKASSLMFGNMPGWILAGVGLELQPCGAQSIRAIASLQSILDPEHPPRSAPFELKPLLGTELYGDLPEPIGAKEVPIFTSQLQEGQGMYLSRAILHNEPYPVKAMLVAGGNPTLTFPDSKTQARAFQNLDFLAVFDLFMTPTARMADLVFPASDFLENLELHDYGWGGQPYLGLVQPVTSDCRGWPAWRLIFELARKLGLEKLFPWTDNRQAIIHRLSGSGVELADLERSPSTTVSYKPAKTSDEHQDLPGHKIKYYSETLVAAGHPGLPTPSALTLPSFTDGEFPFWLSTGDRVPFFHHSQFRRNRAYREKMPEALVDIHPDAARRMGIGNGDPVKLATKYGTISIRANLNEDVRRDCLRVTHGWEEGNANELTGLEHLDPVSGFPWCRALPARVEVKRS